MSEKTIKFDNIRVNKKTFHKSKQTIKLDLVNVDHIVISDKFKHSDDGFKYFTDYKEGEIVRPLCIILPQTSGYIKYFENGSKNMSFVIKDDDVLDKYNEFWDMIKTGLNIKFHSMPLYGEKYIKAKVAEFGSGIKANLSGDEIPKESMHCASIACIAIYSVMTMEKKGYPQAYLEECKCKTKKIKMSKFINTELKSESQPELESDSDLKSKSELESDTQ